MVGFSVIGSVVLTIVTVLAESNPSVLAESNPVPAVKETKEQTRPNVADAKITPEGLIMFRFRRSPQRAMTFSGFMPNGAMTAFSAAADSYQRPTWYSKPSDTLAPPTAEAEQPEEEPQWTKKPKKKPIHPSKYYPSQTTAEEDEEEYDPPSRSKSKGGSATASFNAWFPIVFGGFPNQGGQFGRNGADQSKPTGGDSYSPLSRASEYPGQTVIANSVSNGKGGVASSHAVAYGNRPEGRQYGGQGQYGSQGQYSGQEGYGSQGGFGGGQEHKSSQGQQSYY
uniref:Uncharacterized protein n=1 Tax=Cacopsylla melanoneura TaxID=428564 RepID=A0A8D8UNE8_9HEMI